jgi:glycosyltransferase involved in cell wall biosynthesis
MVKTPLGTPPTQGLKIGIDATNLRLGGGVTHLIELLGALTPSEHSISEIVVWGGADTLARLPSQTWLTKHNPPQLDATLAKRVFWQVFCLSKAARLAGCDLLFVPGGSYFGTFRPAVVMSQNLLPFEWQELRRTRFSLFTLKMLILRVVQSWSFRHVNGVIFLSQYAKKAVLEVTGPLQAKTAVIAHGLSARFGLAPKLAKSINDYGLVNPFQLLYVSNIDAYKHQIAVVLAVQGLREKGYPLHLTLIGPGSTKPVASLRAVIDQVTALDPKEVAPKEVKPKEVKPKEAWVKYLGVVPYEDLRAQYAKADLGLFASSCETFGMILLEKMAMGLPIACSKLSSMQELLADGGLYFDPVNSSDIAATLERYLLSAELRTQKQAVSYGLSKAYSWQTCASQTFTFLSGIAAAFKRQSSP